MTPRKDMLGQALFWLLSVAVVAVVIGNLLGYPVLIGFVETDSMSPALNAGDGFVAVPSLLTGAPEPGDVVVYEAEEVQGGGLVTHRIVDSTDRGYITKGDSNPFTDQDGGEPYVKRDEVLSEALSVGGTVVKIPKLGSVVMYLRGTLLKAFVLLGVGSTVGSEVSGLVLLSAGLVLLLISFLGSGGRTRERKQSRAPPTEGTQVLTVVGFMLLIVLVPANYAMIAPGQEYVIEPEVSENQDITEAQSEVTVRNDGLVAMAVVVEPAEGPVTVRDSFLEVPGGEEVTTTVEPTGNAQRYVIREHRYFIVLPSSVISSLHSVSPFAALLAVNTVLSVGIVGLSFGLVGPGRARSRARKVPLKLRLRRVARGLLGKK
jgi:signal peptidase